MCTAVGLSPKDMFLMRLACFLAGVMLVLSAIIVADSVRRWYGLWNGRGPQSAGDNTC